MIYKICGRNMWESATKIGQFAGAEIDLRDGFIHFSAAHQVKETAARHFQGRDDLVLVAVDEDSLGTELKWEESRGGDLFPHLYGVLETAGIHRVHELPLDADGSHVFPILRECTDS